ncbi:MAG: hypothetical protein IT580_09300 [Verrucomicrobiales bacterium]|nr:hypothetical protein [Verrucomicrobiales bacterium]
MNVRSLELTVKGMMRKAGWQGDGVEQSSVSEARYLYFRRNAETVGVRIAAHPCHTARSANACTVSIVTGETMECIRTKLARFGVAPQSDKHQRVTNAGYSSRQIGALIRVYDKSGKLVLKGTWDTVNAWLDALPPADNGQRK